MMYDRSMQTPYGLGGYDRLRTGRVGITNDLGCRAIDQFILRGDTKDYQNRRAELPLSRPGVIAYENSNSVYTVKPRPDNRF